MLSLTKSLLLGIVLTVFVGLALSTKDENISKLLEQLRARMHMDMTKTLGIRRLDPFTKKTLTVDSKYFGDFNVGNFTIIMNNIRVVGLKQFVLESAHVALSDLRFQFNITIPTNLTVTGNHISEGLVWNLVRIKGSGPFSLNITGLHYTLVGAFEPIDNTWQLANVFLSVGIQSCSAYFQGLRKNGDLFNRLMRSIGPKALDLVSPVVESGLIDQTNAFLKSHLVKVTQKDILDVYNGTKNMFPPIAYS